MKMYRCLICGEIFSMDIKKCPVCGVGEENFEVIDLPDMDESMAGFKLVIIGAGAAGVTLAKEVRAHNKSARITLISKEDRLPYNRTLLTKKFNSNLDKITLDDLNYYKENQLELLLGVEAINVDKDKKEVKVSNGVTLSYDYLVFANGSNSIMLNSGDFNKNNVFGIRTIDDVTNLKKALGSGKKTITIVGGGVLGLELASELALSNKVNIIEKAPYLMFNNFELKDSLKLKDFLISKGVSVYENTSIIKYNYDCVILEDETRLDTDFIIYSIGVSSNIALAKAIGIETNRGILVDEHLETNIKGIYACGDVAEFGGRVVALWSNALDMAKTLAKIILGKNIKYERGLYPLAFKLFDKTYYKIGKLTDDAVIEANSHSLIKYYYEDEILVGALIINNEEIQGRVYKDILNKAIKVEY